MSISGYIPGKPKLSNTDNTRLERVTDRKILDLLEEVQEAMEGVPDGSYFYLSDEFVKNATEKRTEADEERERKALEEMTEKAVRDEAGNTEEQGDRNAFLELAPQAVDKHLTFEGASIVPGFLSFHSDIDVYLGLYHITLHAGTYFLKEGDELSSALVYMLTFDADEILSAGEGHDYEETTDPETGVTTRRYKDDDEQEPISFSATLLPIPIKGKEVHVEGGEYLTYLEYLAWLTMAAAPDNETRDAVFNSAYNVTKETEVKRDQPPKQDGKKPTWRHDPVSKLAQSLSNPALYGEFGTISLDVAGKADRKRHRSVETTVSLEYIGDDEDVNLSRPISEFDTQVLNGYIAQITNGRTMFTATDVFEAAIGGSNPTKKQLGEITESLDRMRFNKLTIDMTQEAEAHKLVDPDTGKPWKNWKVETMLVPADKITMTSQNGRIVEGYVSTREPVVLTHARMTNQITSFPMRYLETKEAGSNTQQNVVIRAYLLKRILQARDSPQGRMKPIIKYSTIYEKAGIDKSNRTVRKRVNDYIEGLLKIWVNMGLISGYTIEKEKQQISKVVVTFDRQ